MSKGARRPGAVQSGDHDRWSARLFRNPLADIVAMPVAEWPSDAIGTLRVRVSNLRHGKSLDGNSCRMPA